MTSSSRFTSNSVSDCQIRYGSAAHVLNMVFEWHHLFKDGHEFLEVTHTAYSLKHHGIRTM